MARTHSQSGAGPRGHALIVLASGLAIVSLTTAAVVTGSRRPDPVALAAADPEPALAVEKSADGEAEIDLVQQRRVLAALAQAGLDAQSLAAAGVTPQEATSIGDAVVEAMSLVEDIETTTATLIAQEQTTGALERTLISGQASPEQVTALATARSALATARAARSAALEALWEHGAAELPPATVARLEHLHTNCQRGVATALRALTCEPGEWAALENAVTHVRVADALEMDPDPSAAQLVSTAEGDPAVVAAAGWLNANGATVAANLAAAAGQ